MIQQQVLGNFLTESYISLRRLENEVLKLVYGEQIGWDTGNIVKVNINQFYGIEINDFAVDVARTALWIAEAQMAQETEDIINQPIDFLPLKTYNNIVKGNALRTDWDKVVPKEKLTYIIGNPPFIGARLINKEQREDLDKVFDGWNNKGLLDYVTCWFKKVADFMKDTKIKTALVATSSISQGEQPAILWKKLMEQGIVINFAYKPFRWANETKEGANVYCVIIGFSYVEDKYKYIFEDDKVKEVKNINAYLADAPNIFIERRNNPICNVPEMGIGNKPIDGGYYLFKKEEMEEFIKKEPNSEKYFRPWYGAQELVNNNPRYCLWLGDVTGKEIMSMPKVKERVEAVRQYRLDSKSYGTRKIADTPTRFHVENMPDNDFIAMPSTNTYNRKYIPLRIFNSKDIISNACLIINSTDLYLFGILSSELHNIWIRTVCGRLGDGLRYSASVVYNNFPWPNVSKEQKKRIEETAKMILDARELYKDSSLADMYGEHMYLYPELLKVHKENDKAVMQAYDFRKQRSESDILAKLMKMYEEISSNK